MEKLGVSNRPRLIGKYNKVVCTTNHYNIFHNPKKTVVYQYPIKVKPDLNADAREVYDEIIMANAREIRKALGSYITSG